MFEIWQPNQENEREKKVEMNLMEKCEHMRSRKNSSNSAKNRRGRFSKSIIYLNYKREMNRIKSKRGTWTKYAHSVCWTFVEATPIQCSNYSRTIQANYRMYMGSKMNKTKGNLETEAHTHRERASKIKLIELMCCTRLVLRVSKWFYISIEPIFKTKPSHKWRNYRLFW